MTTIVTQPINEASLLKQGYGPDHAKSFPAIYLARHARPEPTESDTRRDTRSEKDKQYTKKVRAWAVEAGLLPAGSRGRIPALVHQRYEEAHAPSLSLNRDAMRSNA